MLGRLRTYPQPVFAQGPFLQHESLLLLVPHSVPALRLHGVKVEADGLAGKEAACERTHGGRLHYTLPLLDMGIGAAFKKQIICEGEHVLGHLHVAVKHFPEVIRQACLPGDVVQKPGGTVHPVEVSALVLHRAPMPGSAQGLDFGQVPFGREYQLTALFDRRIEVCRVWMKPHVVVNNAPVLVRVMLLAVVINSERLGGCVLPSSIVMDAYLVYRAGFGRPSCSHGICYKY